MAKQTKPKVEASTQQYLPISAVKEGVVVLNDHSLRSVIMVSSYNFALKNEDEKNAIIASYQSFLNGLTFPIQILTTSRPMDLSGYIESVKKKVNTQRNQLIKLQTEDYINFINQMLEYASIMEKRFYVIVPYYPGGADVIPGVGNILKKKDNSPISDSFENQREKLEERVQIILQGLSSIGLTCAALGTEDLLELYYTSYNPDSSRNQKVNQIKEIDVPLVEGQK